MFAYMAAVMSYCSVFNELNRVSQHATSRNDESPKRSICICASHEEAFSIFPVVTISPLKCERNIICAPTVNTHGNCRIIILSYAGPISVRTYVQRNNCYVHRFLGESKFQRACKLDSRYIVTVSTFLTLSVPWKFCRENIGNSRNLSAIGKTFFTFA